MNDLQQFYDIKKQIYNKIKEYDTIIIHRHFRPDGDCIGSSLGLRDILRQSFPHKKIYSVGRDKAEYLNFVGEEDEIAAEEYQNSLIIIVDTSTLERVSDDKYKLGKEIIKIDHHLETESFGNISYVVDYMPSTTTLIIDFFNTFKDELSMSADGARALYVGTITDTGRFKYSSVNSYTLRLAADLLEYDFDTQEIYSKLYMKNEKTLKLQGYILKNFKTTKNGVSYIFISKHVLKKLKVLREEASSLVNTLDSIKGSMIWILFVQGKEWIRARIRSRHISIVEIARRYRGGGHDHASGASVVNRREITKLVKEADEELKLYKEKNEDKN